MEEKKSFESYLTEDNLIFVENEYIKIGANISLGGALTYLAEKEKKNLINRYDWGRQVQLSFYSGPVPFHPEGTEMGKHWTHTGWNPIQTGDCFFNRAKLFVSGKIDHAPRLRIVRQVGIGAVCVKNIKLFARFSITFIRRQIGLDRLT